MIEVQLANAQRAGASGGAAMDMSNMFKLPAFAAREAVAPPAVGPPAPVLKAASVTGSAAAPAAKPVPLPTLSQAQLVRSKRRRPAK